MKEVFMQMREDDWQGTPEEYLQYHIEKIGLAETKDSLCPSCLEYMITHKPNDEVTCSSCNQEYKIIDNIIKFK